MEINDVHKGWNLIAILAHSLPLNQCLELGLGFVVGSNIVRSVFKYIYLETIALLFN